MQGRLVIAARHSGERLSCPTHNTHAHPYACAAFAYLSAAPRSSWSLERCKQEGHDRRVCQRAAREAVQRVTAVAAVQRANIKAVRLAAKGPATAARRAKLDEALAASQRPSIDQLLAAYGGYLVTEPSKYLGAYLSVRTTASYSIKEALCRVDALVANERTVAQRAEAVAAKRAAEVERARKRQQLLTALELATGRPEAELADRYFEIAVATLALHGVALHDADPSHVLTPAALAAAGAAVVAALAQREAQRRARAAAEYLAQLADKQARRAAEAEERLKLRVVADAVGLPKKQIGWGSEERRVINAALIPHGVALDDADPSHILTPAALATAAAAVRALLTQREVEAAAKRARRAERRHKQQVVNLALAAVVEPGVHFDSDRKTRRVVASALAQYGVALDDGDPAHPLSPAAVSAAVVAVRAHRLLLVEQMVAKYDAKRCAHPGCSSSFSSECANRRCRHHCGRRQAAAAAAGVSVGYQPCQRHGK